MKQTDQTSSSSVQKPLRIIFVIVAISALLLLGFIGGLEVYDRYNDHLARTVVAPKAEEYLSQTYPGNDYIITEIYFDFMANDYHAEVASRSSQDTYFVLNLDRISHKVVWDSYEVAVLQGRNTRTRLVNTYTELINNCLGSLPRLNRIESDFCNYSQNVSHGEYFSPNGLDAKTLILDKSYDVAALGSQYGFLSVNCVLPEDQVNIHTALEILIEIDNQLADNNIGYYVIEINLKDAAYPHTAVTFELHSIHPEYLHREDALAWLQKLWEQQEAHRQVVKESWND